VGGGGAHGKAVGIVHVITIGVGFIINTSPTFIMILILVGEGSIETVSGTGIDGTTDGFPTTTLNKTGEVGIAVDIGKKKEDGTWKDINPFHHKDNRKLDGKDSMNIQGDLTSGNMSNGERSSKDNARFSNLDNSSSRDNVRSSNLDNSSRRDNARSSNLDNSSSRDNVRSSNLDNSNSRDNVRFSNLDNSNSRDNVRFSNNNILSLKKKLKEGDGRT
jgi:hypothetical protein